MKKFILFILLVMAAVGFIDPVVSSAQEPVLEEQPLAQVQPIEVKPLFVYADNEAEKTFFPSQTIGDGKSIEFDEAWKDNPQSGTYCIRIKYNAVGDFGWAGLYWVNPLGNWGEVKGGYDLRFAKKLTFWARGDKGGEHIAVFRFGGLKGNYPDSDNHGMGPIVLTPEWKEYTIDVSQRNMRYIFSGFSFALTKANNRDGCVFYLDNIKYE